MDCCWILDLTGASGYTQSQVGADTVCRQLLVSNIGISEVEL